MRFSLQAGTTAPIAPSLNHLARWRGPALLLCLAILSACGPGPGSQPTGSVVASIREAADPPSPAGTAPVYRFAKISNGAYFYTGNAGERDLILAGFPDFRYEGIAFLQVITGASEPVYRFANLSNGGYFYTASAAERDATIRDYPNMRFEGSTFAVTQAQASGATPVYRLANLANGAYLYTARADERDFAVGLGIWRAEGVGFYAPSEAVAPPANRLQVGYYLENPLTNPEDPTAGTAYLSLPAQNGAFAGAMYFTGELCQRVNVGSVSGTRTGNSVVSNWSGPVDGTNQSGTFQGSLNPATGAFSGTYTVAGGKQFVSVPNCIEYFIAPQGTWEVAPVGTALPSGFVLSFAGTSVNWTAPPGSAFTMVSIVDEAFAVSGEQNATRYQATLPAVIGTVSLNSVPGLAAGRAYVVGVVTFSEAGQRIGMSSLRITR